MTKKTKKINAFTLIEVLVGIFLVLIVFVGIFGAYQLALKVISQSRNKITATSIANKEIEIIRNLPYESVGVRDSFPDGVLEANKTETINNVQYSIETRVDYVIDPADGIAPPEDECPNDYKRIEVRVSWSGFFSGQVKLVTDIAPQTLAQECAQVGGILSVSVFDSHGLMVSSPLIEVKNPETDENIKVATPAEGKHFFSLPAGTYKVKVSKTGYSTERTYSTEEIANPKNPHPLVLEGKLTEISLSIDKVSSFSIDTLSSWGIDSFSDSFSDKIKISESFNVEILEGKVELKIIDNDYQSSGYLISTDISPSNLLSWEEFSWTDSEPTGTEIIYQIFYFDGENWILVPDSFLPGNSSGFSSPPVDLSGLDPETFTMLKAKGTLSTDNLTLTPTLYDWQVSWKNTEPTPISNVVFHLQGEKTIGEDENGEVVYKYFQNHNSGSGGHISISDLEWDSYTFSLPSESGLDLENIEPSPQPIDLLPDTTLSVRLYLKAQNSLFVLVRDAETEEPVFSAKVSLYNEALGYDKTQYTDQNGKTYFIPLEQGTYTLEIYLEGYSTYTETISVSGDESKIINLNRVE